MVLLSLVVSAVSLLGQNIPSSARQADLEWIRNELPRRHINLFSVQPRSAYEAAAARLAVDEPGLSDPVFYTRLLGLAASARDAHTFVNPGAGVFPQLPVSFRWFDDGLFVVVAQPDLAELNGARVLSFNDVPSLEVLERLRPMIAYENDWWFRFRAPAYASNLGILRGIGIAGSNEPVTVKFQLAGGEIRTLEMGTRQGNVIRYIDTVPGFVPPLLRRMDEDYWAEYWPGARTLYIAYRRCVETPSKSIAQFVAEINRLAQQGPIDKVAIDLRANTGGNSLYFRQLIDGLIPTLGPVVVTNPKLQVFGFIDRGTFSSGMNAAYDLRGYFGPTVQMVGEPMGGDPNGFGEVVSFVLPGSRMTGQYSTRSFNLAPGQNSVLVPDIRIASRSADYFGRHDPALALLISGSEPNSGSLSSGEVMTVNAAGQRPDEAIAAGSLAAVLGDFDENAEVFAGGIATKVIERAAGRIVFVVPAELAVGPAEIEVRSGSAVRRGQFSVSSTGLGLFTSVVDGMMLQAVATGLKEGDPIQLWVGFEPAEVTRVRPNAEQPGVWIVEASLSKPLAVGESPVYAASATSVSNAVTVSRK